MSNNKLIQFTEPYITGNEETCIKDVILNYEFILLLKLVKKYSN